MPEIPPEIVMTNYFVVYFAKYRAYLRNNLLWGSRIFYGRTDKKGSDCLGLYLYLYQYESINPFSRASEFD